MSDTTPESASRCAVSTLPGAPTTRRSSPRAFRPAACSPAQTGIKTAAQVALWGGIAGAPFDPCYHRPCDTYDNISLFALDINADAVAYSVLQFAMNTQAINVQRGKGNFKPAPEAQPAD